jgi:hypothetical protein
MRTFCERVGNEAWRKEFVVLLVQFQTAALYEFPYEGEALTVMEQTLAWHFTLHCVCFLNCYRKNRDVLVVPSLISECFG